MGNNDDLNKVLKILKQIIKFLMHKIFQCMSVIYLSFTVSFYRMKYAIVFLKFRQIMNLSESHIFKRSKEISIKMDGWHADMFYVDIFKGFFIFNKLIFKQVFLLQNVIQIWPTKWKIWFVWVPWVRRMK